MVEAIISVVNVLNGALYGYLLIGLLLAAGFYFTVKGRFAQFTMMKDMIRLISSKEESGDGVSSFQAFCISTASRVGTGNMAGVAMAIVAGGPGAIFWMWIIALIGSASSIVESILAQVYKVRLDDGSYTGGPAYYMEKGLKSKAMAIVFAISAVGFTGVSVQSLLSNSIAVAFKEAYNIDVRITTILVVGLAAMVVFGSVKKLALICEKVVPIMAIIYIAVAIFIIIQNITILPATISLIVKSAFGAKQALGGIAGAALMNGIKRGLFSNEAGMGTAPTAAAAATTSHPVKQALVQALGVFIDTLLICGATAFIILLAGDLYTNPDLGVTLIQVALAEHIGVLGRSFIAICILLFSFSTIMGTYFYAIGNLRYLTDSKVAMNLLKVGVLVMIGIGGVAQTGFVWALGDLFMGIMTLINIVAISLLSKQAFAVLEDYRSQKARGLDPVFVATSIEGLEGVECWGGTPSSVDKDLAII